jgi:hypothetical protein
VIRDQNAEATQRSTSNFFRIASTRGSMCSR